MSITSTFHRFLLTGLLLLTGLILRGQSYHRVYGNPGSSCRDFVETTDGGFLMTGTNPGNNALFFQRSDVTGSIVWTQHLALNGATGIAICRTADNGAAVLAENYADNGTLRNLVVRTDPNGAVLWTEVLDNPGLPNGYSDIVFAGDGFVVAGSGRLLSPSSDNFIRLTKLDDTGAQVWNRVLADQNNALETALKLARVPNGDLVLAAEIRGDAPLIDGADFYLARCNAQGNLIWAHTYAKTGYQRLHELVLSPEGTLTIMGETQKTDPVRMTLLKTNGAGAEIWYKSSLQVITAQGQIYKLSTCMTVDGAGNMYVPLLGTDGGLNARLSLMKLDAVGDSVWTRQSDLADIPNAMLFTSDFKFAVAGQTDLSGSSKAILLKTDWLADTIRFNSTLSGQVYWDQNQNCSPETAEPAAPFFLVEARNQFGEQYFQTVSYEGYYLMQVSPGNYSVYAHPLPALADFWSACDTPVVTVSAIGQHYTAPPAGVQSTTDCPYLEVELGNSPIRRCTSMYYFINYCNYGSATAQNASVQLSADPLLSYQSSSVPVASQNGQVFSFDLGDVAPGECGAVQVQFLVSCDAQYGQTLCTEAHIFPDSSCAPPNAQWDGSNLEVTASCNGSAEFTITNTGNDMGGPVDYVIIEDQIMYRQGPIQLTAGADTTMTITSPTGNSYYIRTEQRPGHPGLGYPTAVADMCNGQVTQSLSLQLPLNQADPFLAIDCDLVISSFDPNDKRGFPMGWNADHYLERGEDIEYSIRFQNTGNDTAFLVVVRDQLPAGLDAASIRPGASSHPYTYHLSGDRELEFVFGNILLPDSTTNEARSHGFVNFRVAQRPNLADGTRIENKAAIYFDFNEPVITNTWFHTIGKPLIVVRVDEPAANSIPLSVAPNPGTDYADFTIQEAEAGKEETRLVLFNNLGQVLRQERFTGNTYRFYRNNLEPGLYFFQLKNAQGRSAAGRLILR